MRARSAFLAGAGSVAIIAIGWQAGAGALVSSQPSASAQGGSASSSGSSSSSSSTDSSASGSTSSSSSSASASPSASPTQTGVADGTYAGQAVQTRYGIVQVSVVFSGGKIVDVTNDNVNATGGRLQAVPMLKEEVLAAQSANISSIGGATYTSQGYAQSVQSALDAAGYTG